MSEKVMVLSKVNKGISKSSSVQGYESAWLGRWTQLGNVNGDSKELIRPENNIHGRKSCEEEVEVLPFPMFKVSHSTAKLQTYPVLETTLPFHGIVGSSSKGLANRMPWMYRDNAGFGSSNRLDFPIQEKTTQNLLELIRPVRIYATVDSIRREIKSPEEDGHQILKGSTNSMKLKGKVFDLFPNVDYQHKGGVRLQSLESSEDRPRNNESSVETDTLEMDRLQMIHLSGSISSSSTKGKGRKFESAITRTEIPDMNEEPPLVLDMENSIDGHQGETSNSVTQSMNVDHFLTRENKRVRLEPDPEQSSRWVKRLKTNVLDSSGHDETKSLMKAEKNNNIFLEILKSGINNLQPRNKEPIASEIGEDITLQHPWIQRWCKKKSKSTDESEGQEVSTETETQKEFEKKHYPSIVAMALMGKALSGLNRYGLKKTESIIVWNSEDLR